MSEESFAWMMNFCRDSLLNRANICHHRSDLLEIEQADDSADPRTGEQGISGLPIPSRVGSGFRGD